MTFFRLCRVILSVSAAKGKHLFSQSSAVKAVGECMNINNIFPFISGDFQLDQTSAVYVLFMW